MKPLGARLDNTIAAKGAACFALSTIHPVEISAKLVAPGFSGGEMSWDLGQTMTMWMPFNGNHRVVVPYAITVRDAAKAQIAELRVVFLIEYTMNDKCNELTPDEISHFSGVLGVMHSWPYLRSEVQTLTSKLMLPPLTIPSIVSGQVADFTQAGQLDEADIELSKVGLPPNPHPVVPALPEKTENREAKPPRRAKRKAKASKTK